jgi:hypothetical protein
MQGAHSSAIPWDEIIGHLEAVIKAHKILLQEVKSVDSDFFRAMKTLESF